MGKSRVGGGMGKRGRDMGLRVGEEKKFGFYWGREGGIEVRRRN